MYVNGKLNYYGSDFVDIPHEKFAVTSDGIELNLMKGDLLKLSSPHWRNALGYDSLTPSPYFGGEWDGFFGKNICCLMDGRYLIKECNKKIDIQLIGDIEKEDSLWQIAGNLRAYPDNNWGRGTDKIYLTHLPEDQFSHDYSPQFFNCYYNDEPVFLEKNDEFKFGIIADNGDWLKPAGATLLDYNENCGFAKEDDFVPGDNVGGANIKVNTAGKYTFYLYVDKENTSYYCIVWSRTY